MRLVPPLAALMLLARAPAPAVAQGRGDAIARLEAARLVKVWDAVVVIEAYCAEG